MRIGHGVSIVGLAVCAVLVGACGGNASFEQLGSDLTEVGEAVAKIEPGQAEVTGQLDELSAGVVALTSRAKKLGEAPEAMAEQAETIEGALMDKFMDATAAPGKDAGGRAEMVAAFERAEAALDGLSDALSGETR